MRYLIVLTLVLGPQHGALGLQVRSSSSGPSRESLRQ